MCVIWFSFLIFLTFSPRCCCSAARKSGVGCDFQGETLHLDLGGNGFITDKNVSFAAASTSDLLRRGEHYCTIQLETCSSCLISLTFGYLNLRNNCDKRSGLLDGAKCRCNYIWVAESSYADVSGTPFCGYWNPEGSAGKELVYRSDTKSVTITFFYDLGTTFEFAVRFAAERNRKFYSGRPQTPSSESEVLYSPFFPAYYPRDLVSEYVISCSGYNATGDDARGCRIRLVFVDFLLASESVMEFFDGSRQRIGVASGSNFRPPVILTNSSSLMIRFTANGGRSLGFKGAFSFLPGDYANASLEPNTDCGGHVHDLGGTITMMNMVPNGSRTYDCIWLIRPPESLFALNGNLYLKVNVLSNLGSAELMIREGLTSESPLLERILDSSSSVAAKEHVTSLRSGFYVNLKASFDPSSVVGIAFASFHYSKCFAGLEFLCRNHRCIQKRMVCDGFDHCGDNSDESELCLKVFPDWRRASESTTGKWNRVPPNYYFPKVEHYSALKTATLVFVASSLGLILFLATLIILLYRVGSRNRRENDFQNRLHTITEFLDDAELEEIIDDDPPVYEAPPDYEAAVKVKLTRSPLRRIQFLHGKSNFPDGRGDAAGGEGGRNPCRSPRDTSEDAAEKDDNPRAPPPPYLEHGGVAGGRKPVASFPYGGLVLSDASNPQGAGGTGPSCEDAGDAASPLRNADLLAAIAVAAEEPGKSEMDA